MLILHSRMEELVTAVWMFHNIRREGKGICPEDWCSKQVANQTLWDQLYHRELRREYPGWNTTQHQEWGLFLLEHLLHNASTMRWREHERLS